MNQLLDTILDKVNKQVDHAEIYMERNESVDVDILNDKVNHAKEENVLGIGIRIIKNQRQANGNCGKRFMYSYSHSKKFSVPVSFDLIVRFLGLERVL